MNRREVRRLVKRIGRDLNRLAKATAAKHPRKGFAFERWVVGEASVRGLRAALWSGGGPVDCVINGHRVQCKCLSWVCDANGKRVCMSGDKWRRYKADDFDVLAIKSGGRLFFVPSLSITSRGLVRTTLSESQLAAWENRWDVLEAAPGTFRHDSQMELFA